MPQNRNTNQNRKLPKKHTNLEEIIDPIAEPRREEEAPLKNHLKNTVQKEKTPVLLKK